MSHLRVALKLLLRYVGCDVQTPLGTRHFCFTGEAAVARLISHGFARTTEDAERLGNEMIANQLIVGLDHSLPFSNTNAYFQLKSQADAETAHAHDTEADTDHDESPRLHRRTPQIQAQAQSQSQSPRNGPHHHRRRSGFEFAEEATTLGRTRLTVNDDDVEFRERANSGTSMQSLRFRNGRVDQLLDVEKPNVQASPSLRRHMTLQNKMQSRPRDGSVSPRPGAEPSQGRHGSDSVAGPAAAAAATAAAALVGQSSSASAGTAAAAPSRVPGSRRGAHGGELFELQALVDSEASDDKRMEERALELANKLTDMQHNLQNEADIVFRMNKVLEDGFADIEVDLENKMKAVSQTIIESRAATEKSDYWVRAYLSDVLSTIDLCKNYLFVDTLDRLEVTAGHSPSLAKRLRTFGENQALNVASYLIQILVPFTLVAASVVLIPLQHRALTSVVVLGLFSTWLYSEPLLELIWPVFT